ncbi:MAG: electron transfer flavoprotein subunit beta/FixA family protein [Firmicutes bacterium]|nr:electron transfer flavoprotein subunit beta/FixA family protein [Bacillota bacterium]
MNIVVCLKQTFDTEAKIKLTDEGSIDSMGVSLIINPYDEFAVEEALKIKEQEGGEVTVVSVGGQKAQDALRQALAMGADKAMLVDPGTDEVDEYAAATVLAKALSGLEYDIILGGWRAIDDGSAQVAGRVAELLGIPVVNTITKLEVADGKATATREIEGGSEVLEVSLPAVLTAQKGLNEPRYPSMKGIMKAKKKPMDKTTATELGLDSLSAKVQALSFSLPKPREAGKVIDGEAPDAAKELAKLLHEEAKIV